MCIQERDNGHVSKSTYFFDSNKIIRILNSEPDLRISTLKKSFIKYSTPKSIILFAYI